MRGDFSLMTAPPTVISLSAASCSCREWISSFSLCPSCSPPPFFRVWVKNNNQSATQSHFILLFHSHTVISPSGLSPSPHQLSSHYFPLWKQHVLKLCRLLELQWCGVLAETLSDECYSAAWQLCNGKSTSLTMPITNEAWSLEQWNNIAPWQEHKLSHVRWW